MKPLQIDGNITQALCYIKHVSGTLGDIQLHEGVHGKTRNVPADQAELIDWMLGDVAGLLQEVVCMLSTKGEA